MVSKKIKRAAKSPVASDPVEIELTTMRILDPEMRRWDGIKATLTTRGGFSGIDATRAMFSPVAEDKEPVAIWLREQLEKLRAATQKKKGAPVRLGNLMSRLEIADIAVTMWESLEGAPGPHLYSLFLELMDVDRHRAELATTYSPEFEVAAQIEGSIRAKGQVIGSRKVGKMAGVNHVTVTRWRGDPKYQQLLERSAESPEERQRRIAAIRNRTK